MAAESEIVKTPITSAEIREIENIELLFFAYREFIADPDRILSKYSFGRAHHRALYFVSRDPGMTVAQLLDILNITKQSLSRVLRELVDSGHIKQVTDIDDRRKRHLFLTGKGRELILALSEIQSERIGRALSNLPEENRQLITSFLRAMIEKQ